MSILTISGRVAIVTGSAQGMGYQTAKMMCQNGMKVALVDLNQEKIQIISDELNSLGGAEVYPVACDVSDEMAIEKMVKNVVDYFGLGILIGITAAYELLAALMYRAIDRRVRIKATLEVS
jgi:NAD(P)-dependent dehydrogenase (short-subunit alcohol dehydrogenase family)